MNELASHPKTLYVSIPRSELSSLRAERDALKDEVRSLQQALREKGVAVDLPKLMKAS